MNRVRIASWALQGLVALILTPMALGKFTGGGNTEALFAQLGMEPTGRYAIGAMELAAVALLLMPSSVAWGAILAWGVMSGAIIAHTTVLGIGEPIPPLGVPLGVMAGVCWLASSAILVLRRREIGFLRHMFPDDADASPNRP